MGATLNISPKLKNSTRDSDNILETLQYNIPKCHTRVFRALLLLRFDDRVAAHNLLHSLAQFDSNDAPTRPQSGDQSRRAPQYRLSSRPGRGSSASEPACRRKVGAAGRYHEGLRVFLHAVTVASGGTAGHQPDKEYFLCRTCSRRRST